MSGFVSRIIFQDGFSGTTKKYAKAAEEIGKKSDESAKRVGKLRGAIDKIKGIHTTKFKEVGLSAVQKDVSSMEKKLQRMTNKPVSIRATAKVDRSDIKKARREAKELQRQLKDLTGKKYNVDVDVGGKSVSTSKFGKLGTMLGAGAMLGPAGLVAGGAMAVGGAAIGGAGTLLSAGSQRQSQRVALTHFLGGDEKKANKMMAWASDNAAKTQFSADEAISATQRAVQVADGDTSKAKRLVKLAEDMASLNPGKSVSDAMEALADADVGEMERMKEFGMKISAEDFKAAGGDLFKVKDQKGRTVEDVYKGGTAEGANTAAAKMGTIKGAFEGAIADAGLALSDKLLPALNVMADKAQKWAPKLGDFLVGFGTAVGDAFVALSPFISIVGQILKFFGQVIGANLQVLGALLTSVIIPAIGWIGKKLTPAVKSLGKVVSASGKAIQKAVNRIKNAFARFSPDDLWATIKSWVLGKSTGNKKKKKGHATGTLAFEGGFTQMNENMKGELVALPNGSKIYPYQLTKRLLTRELAGKGGSTNNNHVVINIDARGSNMSSSDVRRLRREIYHDMMSAFDNMALA